MALPPNWCSRSEQTGRRLLTAFALVVLTSAVSAHDFWLAPETFVPAPGKPVKVRLLVGDGLEVETERAFERKGTTRLVALRASGMRDLLGSGMEGKTPFAQITFDKTGSWWIGLERERKTIRLEADKFNDYLAEEGLAKILEQRRVLGEDRKPGRERYSRYVKCLIQVAARSDDTWKKLVEHRLEIEPITDPS